MVFKHFNQHLYQICLIELFHTRYKPLASILFFVGNSSRILSKDGPLKRLSCNRDINTVNIQGSGAELHCADTLVGSVVTIESTNSPAAPMEVCEVMIG